MLSIRGARENNLAGIDLDLALGALIVFTGPSGSGKTSLAFDTLHQEGQRRYLEALAAHKRPGLDLRRPAVDAITGLPPTLALEQGGGPGDPRETVGTATDAVALLGVVFARAGIQHCPSCGAPIRPNTHDEIVGTLLGLPEGTRLTLEAPVRTSGKGVLDEVVRAGFSRVRVGGEVRRVEEITAAEAASPDLRVVVDRVRLEAARRDRLDDAVRTTARAGRGVVIASTDDGERVFVDRPFCWSCDRSFPALEPRLFNPRSPAGQCPTCRGLGADESGSPCGDCEGTRLREESRAVRWNGLVVADLLARRLDALATLLADAERGAVVTDALDEVARRVAVLVDLGLGYLDLARGTDRLSTGERQRLRLAAQVGARLSGVLYVLDEPGAGLHVREVEAVVRVLRALRDTGNTVIAVEHHPLVVAAADRVIDFGPGAGARGGRVVFDGSVAALRGADTATGRWLSGREVLPGSPRPAVGPGVRVRGARDRNLRGVDVDVPTGGIVALHGPSGSGKTALLDTLRHHVERALGATPERLPPVDDIAGLGQFARLVEVEAGGANRSPRSNPATYVGAWDVVRELLAATSEARVRGMDAGFFSLARPGGRCEACKGTGLRRVDLGFLPDVFLACEVCEGRRYAGDVLEVRWKGLDADALLRLRADEAHAFLAGHPRLESSLRALVDVGLGYVPLGQPGHTLSGGEAQRLRLARELARANRAGGEGVLYVLDDPTVGLHPSDVASLLGLLRRLVGEGGTVWLATHDEALAAACDAVIRLGPGGGPDGGRVL